MQNTLLLFATKSIEKNNYASDFNKYYNSYLKKNTHRFGKTIKKLLNNQKL